MVSSSVQKAITISTKKTKSQKALNKTNNKVNEEKDKPDVVLLQEIDKESHFDFFLMNEKYKRK